MEALETHVYNFVKNTNLIKDEEKKNTLFFKLNIIERGIAHIEEDKKYSETQGQETKRLLEELEKEVNLGKINETELNSRISTLEESIRRKDTEYASKLQENQKDWDEINKIFGEAKEKL